MRGELIIIFMADLPEFIDNDGEVSPACTLCSSVGAGGNLLRIWRTML